MIRQGHALLSWIIVVARLIGPARSAHFIRFSLPVLLSVWVFLLGSCGNQAEEMESLGDAFVGSASTPIYEELAANSPVVARLDFGKRVRLLRRRRNFYYVRSAAGQSGWTHRTNLFNEQQVREMNALARFAADAPTQGSARVFATLNVHNHPNRQAPTLFQINEGDKVAIIAHERHPRVAYDPGPLLATAQRDEDGDAEAPEPADQPPPPEPPLPPDLPPSWLRISGLAPQRIEEILAEGWLETTARSSSRASGELWTLVRNSNGLAGWALNARLVPAIPEDVAQYSEGARITSYFSLGPGSEDAKRNHWLWTTLKTPGVAFDFDSYRVFVWNNRLHRFETAMIARDVEGYLPVEVFESPDGATRFRINLRERAGIMYRRTYEINGMRALLVQSVPWPNYDPLKQPPIMNRLPSVALDQTPTPPAEQTFWERMLQAPARAYRSITGG